MKKKLQIFITVAMLSLFLIPVRVNAEPRASGNGYHSGTITYNGKNYSFINSMARSGNALYDSCSTDAYIMRQHNAVTGYFNTYNFGYVYGYGAQLTSTTAGISYSSQAVCPYGSGQVQSIISGSGKIYMFASTTVRSDISVHY